MRNPLRVTYGMSTGLRLSPYFVVVAVLLLLKFLLARHLALGHAFGPGAAADALAILAIVFLAASEGSFAGRRALAVGAALLSLGMLSGVVYASYFEQLPGLRMLGAAGQVTELWEDVWHLLAPVHILFLLDLPVLLAFGFSQPISKRQPSIPLAVSGALSLAVVVAFTASATSSASASDSLSTSYRTGLVAFELSSLLRRPAEPIAEDAPRAALQHRIDELTGHVKGPRAKGAPKRGAFAGKNLIMIQVEALQVAAMGARTEGQIVVPNIEELARESYYFPNTYSQIGRGNTSDAEFIANTSLYPSREQASSVTWAKKEIPALPRLLNEAGYKTFTFHTNSASFWNRFQMYPALGFDRYYDREFFGEEDVIGHGANDSVLYRKTIEVLKETAEKNQPFYAHIVTVTSHYPFVKAANRSAMKLRGDANDTETGRYLRAENYADEQLGLFLEGLESSGLMEESIVVVYGDHFGLRFNTDTLRDKRLRKSLLGRPYNRADYYNVPLIVRVPGQAEGIEYPTVLGQIDIMPTMADLLGVDLSETPHFGRSAFVETPTILTRSSSVTTYIDDEIVFLGGVVRGEDRWYESPTQRRHRTGPVPDLQRAAQIVELSHAYTFGLPEREGASDEVGRIPNAGKDPTKTPYK